MHSVWFLLTGLALLSAPAGPEDPTARAEAMLRRVAQLPSEQQRAWLQRLEVRLIWSTRLTMKRDEAAQEEKRMAALLRTKPLPWQALVELVKVLEQREKAAVARLVRHYRSQVYETFRKQQTELLARQDAWYRVWSAWEAAGSPPEQQDRLMDWLDQAIRNSQPDAVRPLPEDPKFEGGPAKPERRITKPPAAKVEEKPAKPAPTKPDEPVPERPKPQPKEAPQRPAPNLAEAWRPLMPRSLIPQPVRLPDPEIALPRPATLPGWAGLARASKVEIDELVAENVPRAALPPRNLAAGRPVRPVVPAPPWNMAELAPALPSPLVGQVSNLPAVGQVSNLPDPATILRGPGRQPVDPPGPNAMKRALAGRVSVFPSTVVPDPQRSPETVPEIPGMEPHHGPQPPMRDPLAMLPRGIPVESAPTGPGVAAKTQVASVAQAPATVAAKPKPAGAEEQAQVNLEELAARIAGVNLNLHTLEAELAERRPWNADQLDGVVHRLDILVLRQKDLTLFRDLITPEEQTKVGSIEPPKNAIARLAGRIAEVRSQVQGDDFRGTENDRRAVLKRLDELSDQLAGLAAEK
jgi:hypothetical protein